MEKTAEQPDPAAGQRTPEDLTEAWVTEHPDQAGWILEFALRNSPEMADRPETIESLRWLGQQPEWRGRAVELLGIVVQRANPELVEAAETAVRSILRRRRA